ncbi:hypothetical protein QQF45_03660 [Halopseudomonas aestusnigri]|uniref:hypothetical protein n=1 Tax=Halopseudomonas aestusnigri TaxID=857252 RepID=UPI00255353BD|nr:hypothetical protein [Halopseudomonas aestusnigri]MDL2198156.1 hypothetical protein [Halopseudomonas aestusnigri]
MYYSKPVHPLIEKVIGKNPKKRHELILWTIMYQIDSTPNKSAYWPGNLNNITENLLYNNPNLIPALQTRISQLSLVDTSHFKWIDNSKRQSSWISRRPLPQSQAPETSLPWIPMQDQITAKIDLWQATGYEKELFLKQLKMDWEATLSNTQFDWFKDDNRKVKLAWNWLKKNSKLPFYGDIPFEDYEDMMIYFDGAQPHTGEAINDYISKIKARWSQNKYREKNTGKTQKNFMLSNETISNLEELSKFHDVSKARIIEILVEIESIKGGHIDEKLARSKLLKGT